MHIILKRIIMRKIIIEGNSVYELDEDAMKKLVWRYIDMEGNQKIQIKLPEGFDEIGKRINDVG